MPLRRNKLLASIGLAYSLLPQRFRSSQEPHDITVALVWEEDVLVGYGIALSRSDACEIEIIDVDLYSRRQVGFGDEFQLSGQEFQVGVGHIVVCALLRRCPRPIRVDATNSSSRYIFKSLGFVHDAQSGNPCILKMS